MTGGLLQIAAYGNQDIYLTVKPQITFFKTVYKKYTNFSLEYKLESFDGIGNFGNEISCTFSKAGDLLHKLYLQIAIPKVEINKMIYANNVANDQTILTNINTFKQQYDIFCTFVNYVNYNIIQTLYKLLNVQYLRFNDINNQYLNILTKTNYQSMLNNILNMNVTFTRLFFIKLPDLSNNTNVIKPQVSTNVSNLIDFNSFYNNISTNLSNSTNLYSDLKNFLDDYTFQLTTVKKEMFFLFKTYSSLENSINRQNINFAWVDKLGHQIIDRAEIEIGGKVIDFTDAIQMDINYELTTSIQHDLTYLKLIGGVKELTTFDSSTKPSYIMYIPFNFWNCKYSGLSIPLICMLYHDVKINIKLNDLNNCCYYEKLNEETLIENLIALESVKIVANYVYLDDEERKKFAQYGHEYLIDQTQYALFNNITNQKINIKLDFFNPIKQLFWIARDQANIERLKYFEYSGNLYVDIYSFEYVESQQNDLQQNQQIIVKTIDKNIQSQIAIGDQIEIHNSIYYNGTYIVKNIVDECVYIDCDYFIDENYFYNYAFDNIEQTYTKKDEYMGNSQAYIRKITSLNPFKTCSLILNGVELFDKYDGIFFNFVQPYSHNTKSPNYGLNTYSFALNPEEHQPSGFCNFTQLDVATMNFQMNSNYINKTSNKIINISLYAHGYNILKFSHGKAGIIFNI